MTRREGIIKEYTNRNNGHTPGQINLPSPTEIDQLLQTEYNNYTELCSFCSEQPKPKDIWLSETINPIKS